MLRDAYATQGEAVAEELTVPLDVKVSGLGGGPGDGRAPRRRGRGIGTLAAGCRFSSGSWPARGRGGASRVQADRAAAAARTRARRTSRARRGDDDGSDRRRRARR